MLYPWTIDRDGLIVHWLAEEDENDEIELLEEDWQPDDSDLDQVDNSEHNSENELSAEEEEDVVNVRSYCLFKDGVTVWKLQKPPQNRSRIQRNIYCY